LPILACKKSSIKHKPHDEIRPIRQSLLALILLTFKIARERVRVLDKSDFHCLSVGRGRYKNCSCTIMLARIPAIVKLCSESDARHLPTVSCDHGQLPRGNALVTHPSVRDGLTSFMDTKSVLVDTQSMRTRG